MEPVLEELVFEALRRGIYSADDLHKLKIQYAEKYRVQIPRNAQLISIYKNLLKKREISENRKFLYLLRKRKIRSLSGVSPVAILTKPFYCPGKCVYCPAEKDVPKSYLSNEPAVMRAIANKYSPSDQVKSRIETLKYNGHPTDKIELIIMGGTWSAYPHKYQTSFIRKCFNAMNEKRSALLIKAQKLNEKAPHRCVTMVLETRPDFINEKELIRMREFGCTRVEIGVQSIYDDVLELVKRGHNISQTIHATKLLKDAGLKVSYHMMPNLPGSDLKRDMRMFKELFENPCFRPDMMKVYPCVVVPYCELAKWHERGEYRPYTSEELVDLVLQIKQFFPKYLRVSRLIRDIPASSILAGSKVSNLREVVHRLMKEKGIKCQCIRCREIRSEPIDLKNIDLNVFEYDASEGKEFFLSFDDAKKDKLCSLLRLRFSSYSLQGKKHFIKELEGAALIRELHTYGVQVPISERDDNAYQHLGFGKKLVKKAEEISKKHGFKKIAVTAGIGVREYYKKLGYRLKDTYMLKSF